MGVFSIMDIGASGLHAQRIRMEVASTNLANASTTRTPEGGPYKRMEPVFRSVPLEKSGFHGALDRSLRDMGVAVDTVVSEKTEGVTVYDPDHPDANEQGYVELPNVNVVEELVDMMTAARSYEANLSAIGFAKDMAEKALDMGK
jgi:flagellar basal-body rod protein FlgC